MQQIVSKEIISEKSNHNSSFDNIALSYDKELKDSLGKFCNEDISLFAEYKVKIIKKKLFKEPARILEFGCGIGRNNIYMKKWLPESNIFGCDISEKSLEIARETNLTVLYDIILKPEDLLERYKEPFDCIFISNVFHHIPFNEHQIWIDALYQILSKNGNIFIFEHNPYNPITKRIFNTSEIDKGCTMLKPSYCYDLLERANFTKIKREFTLFFIWRNNFFEFLERKFHWLPLGAQYYIWGRKLDT